MPRKQMTPVEKAKAITLWKSGTVTLDNLAARFKRDRHTFVRLFNSAGVSKGVDAAAIEKKVSDKIAEQVAKDALADAAITAQKIKETKDQHYTMAKQIAGVTFKLLHDTIGTPGMAIGTKINDFKALREAASTIKICRDERFAVLGLNADKVMDDEVDLPDLLIGEISDEEIRARRAAEASEMGLDVADLPTSPVDHDADDDDDIPSATKVDGS